MGSVLLLFRWYQANLQNIDHQRLETAIMNPYQLAKLVEWSGKVDTRKRMQKLVFMLKVAGCPIEAEFYLHRFGPYSQDVAELTDAMVTAGILEELPSSNAVGRQFGYRLSEAGKIQVSEVDSKSTDAALHAETERFRSLLAKLNTTNLRDLEIASTIAYFKQSCEDWGVARKLGCAYKSVEIESDQAIRAENLARSVIES